MGTFNPNPDKALAPFAEIVVAESCFLRVVLYRDDDTGAAIYRVDHSDGSGGWEHREEIGSARVAHLIAGLLQRHADLPAG